MVSVDAPVKSCTKPTHNGARTLSLSKSHINRLKRNTMIALRSKCRQRHAATIVKGGSFIASAVNVMKNNPRDFDNMEYNHDGVSISVHAEVAAMRKCSPEKLKGATIYVSRMANCGKPLLSKPCPKCHAALVEAGIRRVVYTDEFGAKSYIIR